MLLGIFMATRWEMNAIRRAIAVEDDRHVGDSRWVVGRRANCRLFVIQTGVGPARAEAVCRKVLARQPLDLAVASGFACALTPCGIGDLLIGTEVIRHDGRDQAQEGGLRCADDWRTLALHAAREAGIPAREGRFITVSRVLWQAAEKQRIAATTGAVGLDMESAAVGAAAAERDIPFLVIRGVSDLVDEDLPFDFNRYLADGWSRAVLACLAKPSRLVGLNRLRRQAAVAGERMTRFYGKFLDSLPSEV
jgi:adenosylhomocysteine nucleosidase